MSFKNFINKQKIAIMNNIQSNITYYLIFQILFNLLFWYTETHGINKYTGDNFLPYYIRIIIFSIYAIPMFIAFRAIDSIFIVVPKNNLKDLYSISSIIIVIITTIFLCNLPPLANFFKKIFKIKNPKIEVIVNLILFGVVIYTGLHTGLFFRSN
jgi:hypothetical protein